MARIVVYSDGDRTAFGPHFCAKRNLGDFFLQKNDWPKYVDARLEKIKLVKYLRTQFRAPCPANEREGTSELWSAAAIGQFLLDGVAGPLFARDKMPVTAQKGQRHGSFRLEPVFHHGADRR
jgi:hypothetical protein